MLKLPSEPKSILIVKLSSIGDVIHALPVATALRRRYPDARICWLVSHKAREIVSGHPHLDRVIVVGGTATEVDTPIPNIERPFVAARVLRSIGFDVALDLQGLIRSSLFAYLSGARIRIGYRSLREAAFLFSNVRAVKPSRDLHVVDSYLRFAEILDAPASPVEFHIATNEQHVNKIESLLDSAGLSSDQKMVALSPGSSWRAKTWPIERLAVVADYIADNLGLIPILVGSGADTPKAKRILASTKNPIIDFTGKTNLKELTVLLRKCSAFIGNDSGPTHLAAAVGKPVVAVYGPTDAKLLAPYGQQHITIVSDVSCRPCRRRSLAERCSHLQCMSDISPQMVCNAISKLLLEQS